MMRPLVLIAGLVLAGCVGTDVGNPQTSNDELRISAEPDAVTNAQALTYANIELEAAWLVVDDIKLNPCNGGSITTEGPFVVDLLAQAPIDLNRGDQTEFCQLKLSFAAADDIEDAPPELAGAWFFAHGTLADGRPWQIRSINRDSLNFVSTDGQIRLDQADGVGLLARLPFIEWIAAGNLDSVDGDSVMIDDRAVGGVYSDYKKAFAEQARLFRDPTKTGEAVGDALAIGELE